MEEERSVAGQNGNTKTQRGGEGRDATRERGISQYRLLASLAWTMWGGQGPPACDDKHYAQRLRRYDGKEIEKHHNTNKRGVTAALKNLV